MHVCILYCLSSDKILLNVSHDRKGSTCTFLIVEQFQEEPAPSTNKALSNVIYIHIRYRFNNKRQSIHLSSEIKANEDKILDLTCTRSRTVSAVPAGCQGYGTWRAGATAPSVCLPV